MLIRNILNLCFQFFVNFKQFVITPNYIIMSFVRRKFLAFLRLSNLAIRSETGRYERPKIDEHLRLCPACYDEASVENESHFLFYCEAYSRLRINWFRKIPGNFHELDMVEK